MSLYCRHMFLEGQCEQCFEPSEAGHGRQTAALKRIRAGLDLEARKVAERLGLPAADDVLPKSPSAVAMMDEDEGLVRAGADPVELSPGERRAITIAPQLPMGGPYRIGIESTGAIGIGSIRIGNECLDLSPLTGGPTAFVLDPALPWPKGLVPIAGRALSSGLQMMIEVTSFDGARVRVLVTVWGKPGPRQKDCRIVPKDNVSISGFAPIPYERGGAYGLDDDFGLGGYDLLGSDYLNGDTEERASEDLRQRKLKAIRALAVRNAGLSAERMKKMATSTILGRIMPPGDPQTLFRPVRLPIPSDIAFDYSSPFAPLLSPIGTPDTAADPKVIDEKRSAYFLRAEADRQATASHLDAVARPEPEPDGAAWESPTDEWP